MSKKIALVADGNRGLGKNLDTLGKYRAYIEDLYDVKGSLKRKEFINQTGWKDFVPVVDDDAARFLKLILQMKKPKNILEIGTGIGLYAIMGKSGAGKSTLLALISGLDLFAMRSGT